MTRLRILLLTLLVALGLIAIPALASAGAIACPTGWGSLPKESTSLGAGEIDNLRVGQHECFDRVVVDIDGPPSGYLVRYVDQVTTSGSGQVVNTPGGARIQFTVHHPKFSGTIGNKLVNVSGYRTLRSVVYAGSFEGYTDYGVGVRARLPFRVFTIPGSHGRIVLDVAQHW